MLSLLWEWTIILKPKLSMECQFKLKYGRLLVRSDISHKLIPSLEMLEGVIFVYDVTNQETFFNLKNWINSVNTNNVVRDKPGKIHSKV